MVVAMFNVSSSNTPCSILDTHGEHLDARYLVPVKYFDLAVKIEWTYSVDVFVRNVLISRFPPHDEKWWFSRDIAEIFPSTRRRVAGRAYVLSPRRRKFAAKSCVILMPRFVRFTTVFPGIRIFRIQIYTLNGHDISGTEKTRVSCEIEDFVETHVSAKELRVICINTWCAPIARATY